MAESMEFIVTVESMERESVSGASVVLTGRDNAAAGSKTLIMVKLDTLPHKARAMPFASNWRVTLEPIEHDSES